MYIWTLLRRQRKMIDDRPAAPRRTPCRRRPSLPSSILCLCYTIFYNILYYYRPAYARFIIIVICMPYFSVRVIRVRFGGVCVSVCLFVYVILWLIYVYNYYYTLLYSSRMGARVR